MLYASMPHLSGLRPLLADKGKGFERLKGTQATF